MNKTAIEWTHRPETGGAAGGFTWNPIRAKRIYVDADRDLRPGTFCTRISPGCQNCYASVINKRFGNRLDYTVPNLEKVEFYIDEDILAEPLKRKRPATIFVGDMFDLFHEAIPVTMIDRVFAVMGLAHWHTFQLLTKRTWKMRDYSTNAEDNNVAGRVAEIIIAMRRERGDETPCHPLPHLGPGAVWWPLRNVWKGTSVESQKYADERIPLLLQTPAAVRFLSVEPMLEAVDLGSYLFQINDIYRDPVDWVICGGESGRGARPFNLAWAESLLQQCRNAGVPFFMKQIGSLPMSSETARVSFKPELLKDSKGGDPSEWPEHLRVREFPRGEIANAE